ncbi:MULTISPECIES: hypothetical protein [unclassified Nocardiopsis]|uniref:hypothetical protein n=1 Tax=unclassified Nocardiopsis TaxID=2649073 RepID=UPI0033E9AED6
MTGTLAPGDDNGGTGNLGGGAGAVGFEDAPLGRLLPPLPGEAARYAARDGPGAAPAR